MKNQLSLFPKNLREETLAKRATGETITILIQCPVCKKSFLIGHHLPIYTKKWMDANWKILSANSYAVDGGACSRQCDMKIKNNT